MTATAAALIPSILAVLAVLWISFSQDADSSRTASGINEAYTKEVLHHAQDRATLVDERLARVSVQTLLVAAYARAVLKAPTAYTPHQPAPQGGTDTSATKPVVNTIYYTTGDDKAIRKSADDSRSSTFYMARENGRPFSTYEFQQLYATAVLDPLMEELVSTGKGDAGDPLVSSAFFATKDGLLRSYPWRDMHDWPGTRNPFQLPMCAWSEEKANSRKIVWTSPYVSKLTGEWVVACLAPVRYTGKPVAVAGCEVPVARLSEILLPQQDSKSVLWLERADGVVLAATPEAPAALGITPVAALAAPDATTKLEQVFKPAIISQAGKPAVQEAWNGYDGGLKATPLGEPADGKQLIAAPLQDANWVVGEMLQTSFLGTAAEMASAAQKRNLTILLVLAAALIVWLLLALLIASMEANRLSQPVAILTSLIQQATKQHAPTALLIAEESELGSLSKAVQQLVDTAFMPAPAAEPIASTAPVTLDQPITPPVSEPPAPPDVEPPAPPADEAPVAPVKPEPAEPNAPDHSGDTLFT